MLDEPEERQMARAMRRAMLGDEHVDNQLADPNPTIRESQVAYCGAPAGQAAKRLLLEVRAARGNGPA